MGVRSDWLTCCMTLYIVLTFVQIGYMEPSEFALLRYSPWIGSIDFDALKDFGARNCPFCCPTVENYLVTVSVQNLADFYLCPLIELWNSIIVRKNDGLTIKH